MDLYSIGEMVIDFIPGSEPGSYLQNAGGAPANLAIAAARCGLDAGLCCSVGDDVFGRFLLDTLRKNNVRVLRPELCREAVTTMAFVTLTETGDRSFTFARKPGADMFLREEDVRGGGYPGVRDRPRRVLLPLRLAGGGGHRPGHAAWAGSWASW